MAASSRARDTVRSSLSHADPFRLRFFRMTARRRARPWLLRVLEHDDVAALERDRARAPRVSQERGNLLERSPIGIEQLRVLEDVLQLELEFRDGLRLVEGYERAAVRQRNENDPGALLERAARMDEDDRLAAEGGELRGRVRCLGELGLRQSHHCAAEVGSRCRRAPRSRARATSASPRGTAPRISAGGRAVSKRCRLQSSMEPVRRCLSDRGRDNL